jgi:hypothetical protein
MRRPEANFDEILRHTQRRADYLDLDANQLVSGDFVDLASSTDGIPLEFLARQDRSGSRYPRGTAAPWFIDFDRLLGQTDFVRDMRDILRVLHEAYDHPVDVEFTMNMLDSEHYKINVVQCRPLQVHGACSTDLPVVDVQGKTRIMAAHGAIVGQSRLSEIGRIIYVVPEAYSRRSVRERYAVAQMLGEINRTCDDVEGSVLLMGPGRWGTSSPELGVPVAFGDINRVSVLCEIVTLHKNLIPDVSLGTHFLNELVETDMLYLAVFPKQEGNYINEELLLNARNSIADLVEDAEKWTEDIRVIDVAEAPNLLAVTLLADSQKQQVVCYVGAPPVAVSKSAS